LSYTIDIYKRKIKPSKDLIVFSAFVSFFPQLVAGPIERATNLLPQFKATKRFDYSSAVDGMRQILWGFFKKVVIADTCAIYANLIFDDFSSYSGVTLFFGSVLFAFQIYGDFSGYSDIAIGTSRLFGFKLMKNFNFPYFSRDIAEFWRKWHISLSTWFRDYLYVPLGGSKGTRVNKFRNVFIIFLISGFWHGANWTFIVWGAINALYFTPLLFLKKNRDNINLVSVDRLLPTVKEFFQISFTFFLVCLAWVFFRSENISNAFHFLMTLFEGLVYKTGYVQLLDLFYFKIGAVFPLIFIVFLSFEWAGRSNMYAIEKLFIKKKRIFRRIVYYVIILIVMYYSASDVEQEFIYFNF
jgi:alginate O-acetyltransferase complex protein AlgI